jgi:hypothetical protein
MRYKSKKYKLTWLGRLNFFILQWFCIRLAKLVNKKGETERYEILKGIVPLTGWWNDYIYLKWNAFTIALVLVIILLVLSFLLGIFGTPVLRWMGFPV